MHGGVNAQWRKWTYSIKLNKIDEEEERKDGSIFFWARIESHGQQRISDNLATEKEHQ